MVSKADVAVVIARAMGAMTELEAMLYTGVNRGKMENDQALAIATIEGVNRLLRQISGLSNGGGYPVRVLEVMEGSGADWLVRQGRA